jgi:hypothetical protein
MRNFSRGPADSCIAAPSRDPEDGRLTVLGPGEESITAFTPYGVDNLTALVKMVKADPDLLRRYTPSE